MTKRRSSIVPPVGDPILPRLKHEGLGFDWTFGGGYEPIFLDSGTTALRLAVEVSRHYCGSAGATWIPAYGCPDILAACIAAGSRPVLYDVTEDSPFYAAGQTPPSDLTAVVAAHFLGLVQSTADLKDIARSAGALLIEDSAQRFPMPGELLVGDAVVLSFGRGKPVSLMEGGCLLLRPHLYPLGMEIASRYDRRDIGLVGRLKRPLHDIAVRPRVYGVIRRLPALDIGKARFKPAPRPLLSGPRLKELASRAASTYQAECSWQFRQQLTEAFAARNFPELEPLAQRLCQSGRRVSRMPMLAPDAQIAADAVSRATDLGFGATRMYGVAQPYIHGAPSELQGHWRVAIRFASRVVTLPILSASVVGADRL